MVVDKLLKKYDKKVVVDSVSFSIPKGKVTSFIGPNGAGKSTVMGMISRLIANDAGIIEFQGKSMHDWKSKELAKHLAILTQSNNIQMKLTVEELVAFGRFPHSGGRLNDKDKDIINKSIEYMELNEFRNRFIDELSGGQRQRAYIAMVIAQDTEFILLDEPTRGVDIGAKSEIGKYIRKLADEGIGVILISSEMNELLGLCDRLIMIDIDGDQVPEVTGERQFDSDTVVYYISGAYKYDNKEAQ